MNKCLYCTVFISPHFHAFMDFRIIYSVGIHEECESSVRFQVLVSCLNSTFMKCVCSSACLGSAYVRGSCTGSMWDTLSHVLHPLAGW